MSLPIALDLAGSRLCPAVPGTRLRGSPELASIDAGSPRVAWGWRAASPAVHRRAARGHIREAHAADEHAIPGRPDRVEVAGRHGHPARQEASLPARSVFALRRSPAWRRGSAGTAAASPSRSASISRRYGAGRKDGSCSCFAYSARSGSKPASRKGAERSKSLSASRNRPRLHSRWRAAPGRSCGAPIRRASAATRSAFARAGRSGFAHVVSTCPSGPLAAPVTSGSTVADRPVDDAGVVGARRRCPTRRRNARAGRTACARPCPPASRCASARRSRRRRATPALTSRSLLAHARSPPRQRQCAVPIARPSPAPRRGSCRRDVRSRSYPDAERDAVSADITPGTWDCVLQCHRPRDPARPGAIRPPCRRASAAALPGLRRAAACTDSPRCDAPIRAATCVRLRRRRPNYSPAPVSAHGAASRFCQAPGAGADQGTCRRRVQRARSFVPAVDARGREVARVGRARRLRPCAMLVTRDRRPFQRSW